MKSKKGFTLMELLAVIALIGVVLLLVVPNVLDLYEKGKKNSFYDEILNLYTHRMKIELEAVFNGRKTETDLR